MEAQSTLVVDAGGYSIKVGMAGDTAPSWLERTCYCKGMDVFGDDACNRDTGDQNLLRSPMDHLFIEYGDVGFSMMEEVRDKRASTLPLESFCSLQNYSYGGMFFERQERHLKNIRSY